MTERPLTAAEESRLKMLLEATPNTWLALDDSQSRCVGRGASIAEAIEEARKNGYEDPIMFRVPPDWTPAILLPCV
jgi:hypothetical protein